jgi:hypothetical protein
MVGRICRIVNLQVTLQSLLYKIRLTEVENSTKTGKHTEHKVQEDHITEEQHFTVFIHQQTFFNDSETLNGLKRTTIDWKKWCIGLVHAHLYWADRIDIRIHSPGKPLSRKRSLTLKNKKKSSPAYEFKPVRTSSSLKFKIGTKNWSSVLVLSTPWISDQTLVMSSKVQVQMWVQNWTMAALIDVKWGQWVIEVMWMKLDENMHITPFKLSVRGGCQETMQ